MLVTNAKIRSFCVDWMNAKHIVKTGKINIGCHVKKAIEPIKAPQNYFPLAVAQILSIWKRTIGIFARGPKAE